MSNFNPFFGNPTPPMPVGCTYPNCNSNRPFHTAIQAAQNMQVQSHQFSANPQKPVAYMNNCCSYCQICNSHTPQIKQICRVNSPRNYHQCDSVGRRDDIERTQPVHSDYQMCCNKASEKKTSQVEIQTDNECKFELEEVPMVVHNCVVEKRITNNRESLNDSRTDTRYEFVTV